MTRREELIINIAEEHKGEVYFKYNINDLIKEDFLKNKDSIQEKTIKEIADLYGISYGLTALFLRATGLKAKREYNKIRKTQKKEKVPKMTKEEHEVTLWASTFNDGKVRYVYYDMIRRCYKQTDKGYINYGARGITVCDEWRKDCKVFYKWAKENGYNKGLQLDRIDNDKGYSPDNCHWVTAQENSYNKRNTRKITYKGETHTLIEWESITGINKVILADRIYKYKWSIERALTQLPELK